MKVRDVKAGHPSWQLILGVTCVILALSLIG
jgi:hypothetical protein